MTCKPRKQLVIVFNYVRTWSYYVSHPQRSREILECFIVSSVAKDLLVLSQYYLHHGSFLLVTPLVMSSYKSTITHCKSTFLWWRELPRNRDINTLLNASKIYSAGRNANHEGNVSELRLTFLLLLNCSGGNSSVINHWFFIHTIRNWLPLNLQVNCEKL